MKQLKKLATVVAAVLLSAATLPSRAGDGHDHGDAPPVSAGPASPRFTAVSESFELVGVVNGKQVTLFLDRYADGSPVKDAKLELELGGVKIPVESHAEGEFEAVLTSELKPGTHAIAATVVSGEESDLLAGELDLHDAAHEEKVTHTHSPREYALWAGAAAVLLVGLWMALSRLRGNRHNDFGGAA